MRGALTSHRRRKPERKPYRQFVGPHRSGDSGGGDGEQRGLDSVWDCQETVHSSKLLQNKED